MSRKDLLEHLARCVKEAEDSLTGFKRAIAEYHLRTYARDVSGERNITDLRLKEHEAECEEYRRLMREWSSE
jgi:hypothetical protein